MATTPRRRQYASRSRQNPPNVLAIGILVVLVGAVFAVFLVTKKPKSDAEPVPQADPEDIFGDLPEDLPPGYTKPPAGAAGDAMAEDIFGDVGDPLLDPTWTSANTKARDGLDLIRAAVAAHEAGDSVTAKSKGAQAQKLLEEALDSVRSWVADLEKRLGPEHSAVKRVTRRTTMWRRELMALRKNANM